MMISSFHRAVAILLTAFVFTGFQVYRQSLFAEDVKDEPVAREAKPQADQAKPDDSKPREENPGMKEKTDATEAGKDFDIGELINPIQELFGIRVQPAAVQVEAVQEGIQQPDADNNPIVQQFVQIHQSKLKAELRFVRLICNELTPEQRPKVRIAAENSLKQYAQGMAKQQNQFQRGIVFNQINQESVPLIQKAILTALKDVLSEEQMARFKDESQKRNANRKRAVILTVISLIDGRLFLEQEQREKIEQSLSTRWQESWDKWSMYGNYFGQYLPPVPDECVVFCLNSEQKKIWGGLQKVDFGWWNNNDQGLNQDDDQWWGLEANGGQPIGVMIQQGVIVEGAVVEIPEPDN